MKMKSKMFVYKRNKEAHIGLLTGFTPYEKHTMMSVNKKIKNRSQQRGFRTGFTMLEMIVAVGIFSVSILIAVSTFLNLQGAEKKVQSSVDLQNNLRFVLEIMAKEIRTGEEYHCGDIPGEEALDCPSGEPSITFRNALGETVIYRKIGSSIQKSSDGGEVFRPLTADIISVDDLRFYIVGAPSGDSLQPRVVITVKASVNVGTDASELALQTAISQRKPSP